MSPSIAALCILLKAACLDLGEECDRPCGRVDRIKRCAPARRCLADWERWCSPDAERRAR